MVNDVLRAFHHPALRNDSIEIQRNMFNTVRKWAEESPHRHQLNQILGSESVKAGKNHILANDKSHAGHGAGAGAAHSHGSFTPQGAWGAMQDLGHGKVKGSLWGQLANRDLASMQGHDGPSVSASTYLPPTSPSPAYGGGPGQPPVSPGYGYHGSGPVGSGYGGPPPPQPAYGQPAYQGYNQPPPTAQNTYWQQPGAGQSQHHGHPPYHHGGGSGYPGAGYHGAGGASAGYYGQQQPPYGGGYGGGY